jgi:hypothetical protein
MAALSDANLASPPPVLPLRTVACKFDSRQQWYGQQNGRPKNKWINWRPGLGCLDSDQPDLAGTRADVHVVKCTDDANDASQNWTKA